jgi:hypothetical protein
MFLRSNPAAPYAASWLSRNWDAAIAVVGTVTSVVGLALVLHWRRRKSRVVVWVTNEELSSKPTVHGVTLNAGGRELERISRTSYTFKNLGDVRIDQVDEERAMTIEMGYDIIVLDAHFDAPVFGHPGRSVDLAPTHAVDDGFVPTILVVHPGPIDPGEEIVLRVVHDRPIATPFGINHAIFGKAGAVKLVEVRPDPLVASKLFVLWAFVTSVFATVWLYPIATAGAAAGLLSRIGASLTLVLTSRLGNPLRRDRKQA